MKRIFLIILVLFVISRLFAQELFIPRDLQRAYNRGSRSSDGNPGSEYFQNRVNYNIQADFNPVTRVLKGTEKITYQNNSPYPLRYIVIRLYQNIFKEGGVRGREVHPEDVHKGVKITSLTIKGKKCDPESDNCILRQSQTNVFLPFNCAAKTTEEIEIGWEFTMPANSNDRFGGYDSKSFFMGYWFPQVAVFDDIHGWDIFDYNAVAEFYNEYGDFDVQITVPQNYIVWGTGILQNPDEVLNKKYFERYSKAQTEEKTVNILTKKDRKPETSINDTGPNTWHYKAFNVNDFAFGTSGSYLWDASGMTSRSGSKIFLQTAYNPDAKNFDKVVDIARWNIEELEKTIIGIDFPYPAMTVFNGTGGMEYPMIINDHDGSLTETIFVTSHEITHTYFPFLVGTNQRRHGWFDEGLVTMLGLEVQFLRDSSMNLRKNYVDLYPLIAGTQMDIPPIVNSINITDNVFQLHEYIRPSLAFWTLRDIMGNELLKKCIIEFTRRWEGKHPTPWDFYNTCKSVSGEDYGWFFEAWFNQYSYPDLSILSAVISNGDLLIVIENTGGMPFPSKLIISNTDGSQTEKVIDGKLWKDKKTISLTIQSDKNPASIELSTTGYPDCNDDNNYFTF